MWIHVVEETCLLLDRYVCLWIAAKIRLSIEWDVNGIFSGNKIIVGCLN